MQKAKLYFSNNNEQTREAAISRAVELALDEGFSGATVTRTVGVWNGNTEPGFTFEIIQPTHARTSLHDKVEAIAIRLALEYSQDNVLVVFGTVQRAILISADGSVASH